MKKTISTLLALCMLLTVIPLGSMTAGAETGVDVQFWSADAGSVITYMDDTPSFTAANYTEGSAALALEAKEDNPYAFFFLDVTGGAVPVTGASYFVFDLWCQRDGMLDGATGWTDLYTWTADAVAQGNGNWDAIQSIACATAAGNVSDNNGPEQTAYRACYTGLKAGWNTVVFALDNTVTETVGVTKIRMRLGNLPNMKKDDVLLMDDFRFVSADVVETVLPVQNRAKAVIALLSQGIAALDTTAALAAYNDLSEEAKAYVPAALIAKANSIKTGVDVSFRSLDNKDFVHSYFEDRDGNNDTVFVETENYLEGTGSIGGVVKTENQEVYLFIDNNGQPVDASGASYLTFDVYVPRDNFFDGAEQYWSDVRGDDQAHANQYGEYENCAVFSSIQNSNGIRQALTGVKEGWNHIVVALDHTVEATDVVSLRIRLTNGGKMQNMKKGDEVLFDDIRLVSADVMANEIPKRNAAKAVTLQIRALPAPAMMTLSDEAAVNAAKAAYDAVEDSYKDVVIGAYTLQAAVDSIVKLKKAAEEDAENKAAAEAVDVKINAIGEVTLDSESAIAAAREAYDALNDTAKAMVTAYSVLTAAEATLAELKQAELDKAAAKAVSDTLAALPSLEELALSHEQALKDVRAAYEALSEAQKKLVENLAVLTALEAKMVELKAGQANEEGFVIDGVLDKYYRDADAEEMNIYHYDSRKGELNTYVTDGGWDLYYGDTDHDFEIYTAYDDDYIYFYAKAYDTVLTKTNDDPNRDDSIAIYFDPDPTSWDNSAQAENGGFYVHTDDPEQGDLKFRLHGADLTLDDMTPHAKTFLGGLTLSEWLNNPNNLSTFRFDDDQDGSDDGYGLEVRFPRNDDSSKQYQFQVSCGSYKENYSDQYTWSFYRSWWLDYSGFAQIDLVDDPNPFLDAGEEGNPNKEAAAAADALIDAIPEELTEENYNAYKAAVEAARAAYDGLEPLAKAYVQKLNTLTKAEKTLANFSGGPSEEYDRGDIDRNGKVDAVDALLVLKAAVGKAQLSDDQKTDADLNGDGKVDAVDALTILKIAVGKE